jgi:4-hydroxybenzoate polyprenyltransferase
VCAWNPLRAEGSPDRLRREPSAIVALMDVRYSVADGSSIAALIRLLRPTHWIKNTFVFAGILFGVKFSIPAFVHATLLAVAAFCLMSSCVYILNDYLDRESDRIHPVNRYRPIASGRITAFLALSVAAVCLCMSALTAWLAGPRLLAIVLIYLGINCAYSLRLKKDAVVDVFCIAAGFMLRILAGTWGIGIPPSGWLMLTGMFLTLFLGFAKRRAEWRDLGGEAKPRIVLNDYSQPLLDSFLSITLTGTALCYGLFTLDPQTIALHHTNKLIYTMPLVLFGLFRYLFILYSCKKGENPSVDIFADPPILLCGLAYLGSTIWILNG